VFWFLLFYKSLQNGRYICKSNELQLDSAVAKIATSQKEKKRGVEGR